MFLRESKTVHTIMICAYLENITLNWLLEIKCLTKIFYFEEKQMT